MNAQITFILSVYNLETDLSAEEISEQITAKIEPIVNEIITAAANNEGWISGLETRLEENIAIPEVVRRVFEANNITPKISARQKP